MPLEEEPAVLRDGNAVLEPEKGPSDRVTVLSWADVTACTVQRGKLRQEKLPDRNTLT